MLKIINSKIIQTLKQKCIKNIQNIRYKNIYNLNNDKNIQHKQTIQQLLNHSLTNNKIYNYNTNREIIFLIICETTKIASFSLICVAVLEILSNFF